MTTPDFTQMTTQNLIERLRFHENDNGTTTMNQEMRRMFYVQELSAELQRRGIDPWKQEPKEDDRTYADIQDRWALDVNYGMGED